MAKKGSAWGMEVGAYAIKAIRLEREGEQVRVTDFACIPHKKVLTTPDLDQNELVRLSLGQFISQKTLEGEHLVMSVPGHAAFARFAKLPPVEPRKVPDIVKFEAVQQIPFPIEQVEWDYQTFMAEDSPEVEVGIFAITRDRVQHRLSLYAELGISPEALTLSPVALYNAMAFDRSEAGREGPVVYLDIGTSATDVVVADEGRCWIRTFPLGGTHFTEAIASAFKLSYSKAEKLKLEAAHSKYAKQIMQAMRPVFSDLLQDLQRSIGYYQTSHTQHELKTMVGLGSTFKIPGLRKFLGQQLQIDVFRLDEYRRIQVAGREAASFAENAVNMATAYGLALQGVGLAAIDANLVPVKSLRDQLWQQKTKWFAAAAAITIAGSAMMLWRPIADRQSMDPVPPPKVAHVLDQAKQFKSQFDELQARSDLGATAGNMRGLLEHRAVWPHLVNDVALALAATNPQAELLGPEVTAVLAIDPKERRLAELRSLSGAYRPPEDVKAPRRIDVTMLVEVSHQDPQEFLNDTVARWLRENAEPAGERAHVPYRIVPDSIRTPYWTWSGEADESGRVEGAATEPGDRPKPASDSGSRQPPSPGGAGGGMAGSGGAGGGAGFGGGSPERGRRKPTKPPRSAPGPGSGGLGTSGAPPATPSTPRPPVVPGSSGDTRPAHGDAPAQEGSAFDWTSAPVPQRPARYPKGAKLYRIPMTFTVEILGPSSAAPAPAAARADGASRAGGGSPS